MREIIHQEVSVVLYFNAHQQTAQPYLIKWQNQEYYVGKIGYHHRVKIGQELHHIYELTDKNSSLWFRLNLNTNNLHWLLEAISDGLD